MGALRRSCATAASLPRSIAGPTEVRVHRLERCPECGLRLSDGSVHRTREVIEIPVVPVQIIEHRFLSQYCGRCDKSHVAKADLGCEVVGKRRIGIRLMSLIAYLGGKCRMTKRAIQAFLETVYNLHLGLGQISELLHPAVLRGKGRAFYDELLDQVRGSPVVHADETGWREDGVNGYVWSFSTPDTRLYVRDRSRGHSVPESVLGEAYQGVIVSDFYGGYNYHLGEHQRCWVHLPRSTAGPAPGPE
jgi:transposase